MADIWAISVVYYNQSQQQFKQWDDNKKKVDQAMTKFRFPPTPYGGRVNLVRVAW